MPAALVAPCACAGGQKWVHLECLHRWQRSVLVTQPTHPAFYERDERQFVCQVRSATASATPVLGLSLAPRWQVCKTPFNIKPPSRAQLMAGFTGPELAALLGVGCFIVTEKETSDEMADIVRASGHMHQMVGTLPHWIEGVYLITEVEGDGASDGVRCPPFHRPPCTHPSPA